ncbi:MAG: O-antigen ligase family protein [Acidobacteriota bacterium]
MTTTLLALLTLVVGYIVVARPPVMLIPLALLVYIKWQHLSLGGIFIDGSDVITGGLATALVLRSEMRSELQKARFPMLLPWLFLVCWSSVAYLQADLNQRYVAGASPVQLGYQLYRYAWKDLIYFPIALVLLRQARGRRVLTASIIAFGIALAAYAIPEGMNGIRAGAPLGGPNSLSPALIAPILFAFGYLIADQSIKRRWLLIGILLILVRALLFTRSRGGMTGCMAGAVVIFGLLFLKGERRTTAVKWGLAISLGILMVLMVFPSILDRPNVAEALTIFSPSDQHTFQWRTQERWPYFLEKIKNNLWLGVGTDFDSYFGPTAATPHNGYASLSLISGVPAMLTWVLFAAVAGLAGFRTTMRSGWGERHVFSLCAMASVVGYLTHNLVDRVLATPVIAKTFWMLVAVLMLTWLEARDPQASETESEELAPAPSPDLVLARGGSRARGADWA